MGLYLGQALCADPSGLNAIIAVCCGVALGLLASLFI